MTNYIDAEKLIHDLEERIFAYSEGYAEGDDYRKDAIETLLKDVKYQLSLQQEQPEIDLEKEVEKFCLEYDSRKEVWFDMTPRDKKMLSIPTWSNFAANIARHFYELGKKGCNI